MVNIDFCHIIVPGSLAEFWPQCIKRIFDILISLLLLIMLLPLILLLWFIASIDTDLNGLFTQVRIGQHGKHFLIYKIRTMRYSELRSSITIHGDCRITKFGFSLRRLLELELS